MRIRRIDSAAAPAELQSLYQALFERRGNVPNMFRTVAHRPELLRTMLAHYHCVMEQGTVSPRLKELLAVRVSQLNHCDYCLASHTALAKRQGWSEAVLHGLEDSQELPLEEPVKLALRFAERMSRDSHRVEPELFEALRRHFDEGQIVEIAAVVGLFDYFNRFNNALEMEPTRPGER